MLGRIVQKLLEELWVEKGVMRVKKESKAKIVFRSLLFQSPYITSLPNTTVMMLITEIEDILYDYS